MRYLGIVSITFILALILIVPHASAQESPDAAPAADSVSPWEAGGKVGVTFNQVALSNWAGGGDNTLAVGSSIKLFGTFLNDKQTWTNEFFLGYGFTKIEGEDFRKSDDKLTLLTKYDYNATETLLYSALADFRTQVSEGFDYEELNDQDEPRLISNALAPGYLTLSLGATWRPVPYFEAFLAPISNRIVLVTDRRLSAQGAFGVDSNETIASELGSSAYLKFQKDLIENVSLGSNLTLFAPYDAFTTMVVRWESLLNMKVNDYITTSITFDVLYDENVEITRDDGSVGPATQIKEALNIGIGYQF